MVRVVLDKTLSRSRRGGSAHLCGKIISLMHSGVSRLAGSSQTHRVPSQATLTDAKLPASTEPTRNRTTLAGIANGSSHTAPCNKTRAHFHREHQPRADTRRQGSTRAAARRRRVHAEYLTDSDTGLLRCQGSQGHVTPLGSPQGAGLASDVRRRAGDGRTADLTPASSRWPESGQRQLTPLIFSCTRHPDSSLKTESIQSVCEICKLVQPLWCLIQRLLVRQRSKHIGDKKMQAGK